LDYINYSFLKGYFCQKRFSLLGEYQLIRSECHSFRINAVVGWSQFR